MTRRRFDDALRRPAAQAGDADHPARDGPGGVDPGGDRGDRRCASRATRTSVTGIEEPRASPAAWRSTASPTASCCARGRSTTSGSSRPRATPAARSAPRSSSGTSCSTSRAPPAGNDRQQRLAARPALRATTRSRKFLDGAGAVYTFYDERGRAPATRRRAAGHGERRRALCRAAWSSGRAPSAARSILGDARSSKMQSVMNLKIKFRESFRPFAPAVLRERAHEYFEIRPGQESPYMLLVAPVRDDTRGSRPRAATAPTAPRRWPRQGQRRRARASRPSPTSTTPRACRRSTPCATRASTRSSRRSRSGRAARS